MGQPDSHPLVRRLTEFPGEVQTFGTFRVLTGLAILSPGPRRFCSGLVAGDTELRIDGLVSDGRGE
jgi:hypothetical protein